MAAYSSRWLHNRMLDLALSLQIKILYCWWPRANPLYCAWLSCLLMCFKHHFTTWQHFSQLHCIQSTSAPQPEICFITAHLALWVFQVLSIHLSCSSWGVWRPLILLPPVFCRRSWLMSVLMTCFCLVWEPKERCTLNNKSTTSDWWSLANKSWLSRRSSRLSCQDGLPWRKIRWFCSVSACQNTRRSWIARHWISFTICGISLMANHFILWFLKCSATYQNTVW